MTSTPPVPPSEFRAASDADVQWITTALELMIKVGGQITKHVMSSEPPRGSLLYAWWQTHEPHDLSAHVADSTVVIEYGNISAFDHTRAFLSLLQHERPHATSLATVARGSIESLGRSYYLLTATDAAQLTHRYFSLLYDDLTYPAKYGEEMSTRDGDPSDPVARREEYRTTLAGYGMRGPARILQSTLVAQILDDQLQSDLGKRYYSQLSGVAHGHRLQLNNFVIDDGKGGIVGLIPRRELVVQFAELQHAALCAVLRRLVAVFGDHEQQVSAIASAMRESGQALAHVEMPDK